ncbi:MAG TPA: SPFH domain-containing protein [Usitatibacter sp.]|nr:SPFH domain-containing protein [Usitatibacter sp.]
MFDRLKSALARLRPAQPAPAPMRRFALLAAGGLAAWAILAHAPIRTVGPGESGIRENRLTGEVTQWREGTVLVLPFVHEMHVYSIREHTYRPGTMARADGPAPLQSLEGLSIGVDLSVRYGLDPARLREAAGRLPRDIDKDVVQPAVAGVVYPIFARYTVREIFSTKRSEIRGEIVDELGKRLAADGIALGDVLVGKVDLPADYRHGMEQLLAEEMASDKMRYTLEIKQKRVKEVALEGEAEKERREKIAEAAAREQVIAAQAQEEAMQHVLPFKQRQIEQRKLEAEAEKQSRIRGAQASAEARRIEARGESDAREKLADAEAYRLERVGKASAEQMAREGEAITAHPLLIQKALADKLSDKVQVIVAPPSATGVITAALLGGKK